MRKKFLGARALFIFCLLTFLFFPQLPVHAKKEKKHTTALSAPLGAQPYPHQWFETKTKKGASVFGQAYRPRSDLVVLEMLPQSSRGEQIEIKSVRIKTASGKVYEGQIRRLPFGFMPTARQNYTQPEGPSQEIRLSRESSP